MDFHQTWNLNLLTPEEDIQVSSPVHEPPYPGQPLQSVLILQEGSWHLQTRHIFSNENLNVSFLSSKEYIKIVIKDPSPCQEHPHAPKLL